MKLKRFTFVLLALASISGAGLVTFGTAYFASTGFTAVSLGESVNDASNVWGSPTNIYANDNAYATTIESGNTTSDRLRGTMATPFAVPAGATIDGVEVRYRRKTTASLAVTTTRVQLTNGGTLIGTQKSAAGDWEAAETLTTLGTSSDVWGATLNDTVVNSTTFGACINVTWFNDLGGSGSAQVDQIEINVHYTAAASSGGKHLPTMGVGLLTKSETGWRPLKIAA